MDRFCEFCASSRPVIYCKADEAYLCLSCDSKVHSANPLSNRHPRTLICESCNCRPTCVRCFDHQKFMCRGCDNSQHEGSCQHRKRVINGYVGCPSAGYLGALWGFDLNQFATSACSGSGSSGSINLDTKNQNALLILQQLVDLRKLQKSDDSETSSLIRRQEQASGMTSSLIPDTGWKQDKEQQILDMVHSDHHSLSLGPDSLPFSQLDNLTSSSNDGSSLQGDSFWQCKSPVQSGQLWSQNMQDLGVCEELACLDDLNIPDVDLTFRNFEELFRGEPEGTINSYTTALEDVSMATSASISRSSAADHQENVVDSPSKRARYSARSMSFSHSRLSAESSRTDCIDSGISPIVSNHDTSCGSPEHRESAQTKAQENIMASFKGKNNVQKKDQKQGQCGYRKARSDVRKRVKSQSWKSEGHESATRSY